MTSFAVVGAGFRAAVYWRIAARLDGLSCVGAVVRSPRRLPVPAYASVDECLAGARPDFLVTAVPRMVNPEVVIAAVRRGVPVLAETPPAPDAAGLRELWAAVGGSGLVQVAEQYPLMPTHAARAAAVDRGLIGAPSQVHVSSTQLYHAVSLIRGLLGPGREPAGRELAGRGTTGRALAGRGTAGCEPAGRELAGCEPVTVRATRHRAPLLDPLNRAGWTGATEPRTATTTIATLDFGAGRRGLYDFTDNQTRNQLRFRRLLVRGSHGELRDDEIVRLAGPRTIVRTPLVRGRGAHDPDTGHITLGDEVLFRNPYAGLRFNDDEIATAALLEATAAWVRGAGPEPYPLAEGAQDHLIGLAIEEAAETGRTVTTGTPPWGTG